jgi:hypothetical protein
MYIQRYLSHVPAAGEVMIFDRSWHNRAGVERVMGFCAPEETRRFLDRGTANAYEVIRLEDPMVTGTPVTVQVREATSTGWSERRTTHFVYISDGVVAE